MDSKHPQKDVRDKFGNLWLVDKPCRSKMTAKQFAAKLTGYPTIAVHRKTDQIFAAGQNEQLLEKGFLYFGLDPTSFQLEPGPFVKS